VPRKALNLALHSLAALPSSTSWEFHILGEGKLTFKWQVLAKKLGIEDQCYFHGWVTRDRAMSVMQEGHLMLITSLRDLTSTVTIEALSLGLPVVCLDHCGFSEVVDENCGVKIPVKSPRQVIADISKVVQDLAQDEDKRRLLANGALKRAGDFTWEDKARRVDELYRVRVEEARLEAATAR
jgi:glycosyltransferase involved in cell wall biosynthesis